MKKFAIYSLVGLLTLSCSVSSPNNSLTVKENFTELSIKYNFADLEKEYKSFSTKALSDGYVKRIFNKFLTISPNSTQIIRQLEFARYLKEIKSDTSYFNSLKTVISDDKTIYTKIIAMSDVVSYKTANPATFGTFIDNLPGLQGIVTTIAGSNNQTEGFRDGTDALFRYPVGIVLDSTGNIYVADRNGFRIRKITQAGVVSTFAGDGTYGSEDGTAARFKQPQGLSIDVTGNLYLADDTTISIRKITPAGVVSTFAGNGTQGSQDGTSASFTYPRGIAVDNSVTGNIYVSDTLGHKIRKITPAGVVSTFAGDGTQGFQDGTAARFKYPYGMAVDGSGNVYIADANNHAIRKITPAGVVSTIAGNGTSGNQDGTGANARFNGPSGVTVDSTGSVIYVADGNNNLIRKVTDSGVVTTIAGSSFGHQDGTGTSAQFNAPSGITMNSSGSTIYVTDYYSIRKIQ